MGQAAKQLLPSIKPVRAEIGEGTSDGDRERSQTQLNQQKHVAHQLGLRNLLQTERSDRHWSTLGARASEQLRSLRTMNKKRQLPGDFKILQLRYSRKT